MEHLVQGPIHLYVILSQLSTLRYGQMHLYVILSELSTSRYGQMHLYVIQSELSTSRYGLSAPLPGFGRACPHGSNLVQNMFSSQDATFWSILHHQIHEFWL